MFLSVRALCSGSYRASRIESRPLVSLREQGQKAEESSRISALTGLMKSAGLSLQEGADVVADVVNAMVVRFVIHSYVRVFCFFFSVGQH